MNEVLSRCQPMKSVIKLFVLFLIYSCQNSSEQGVSNPERIYGFKSAYIEYTFENSSQGYETEGRGYVWIDDFGKRKAEKIIEVTAVSGSGLDTVYHINKLILTANDSTTEVDLTTGEGYLSLNRTSPVEIVVGNQDQFESLRIDKDYIESSGGDWIGSDNYLGLSCDVFEISSTKQWIYKGYVLQMQSTDQNTTLIKRITKFREDTVLATAVFNVPSYLSIRTGVSSDGNGSDTSWEETF